MYGPVSQFGELFFYKFFATINLKQTSWAWHQSIIEIYLGDMFIYGPVSSLLSPFFLDKLFWSHQSAGETNKYDAKILV